MSFDAGPIIDWLLREARQGQSLDRTFGELCERIDAAGIDVDRVNIAVHTLHPEIVGISYLWRKGASRVRIMELPHGELSRRRYLDSPVRAIAEGHGPLLCRIDDPDAAQPYPIVADVARQGIRGYLALPLPFHDSHINALSLCTRTPGGFTALEVDALEQIALTFTAVLQVHETRRLATTLLDTYLGRQTGARVLEGRIRRGDVERIEAAIFYCDMRGFTRLSQSREPPEIMDLLCDYFDCVGSQVEAQGGEILKFIGDALLAIFPVAAPDERAAAAEHAHRAAVDALAALDALNAERDPPIEVGVSLHLGEVAYGNLGSRRRLDFTVIGSCVNEVVRMEGLCRPLGEPLVVSAEIAGLLPARFRSLGRHALRGLDTNRELFGAV